MKCSKKNIIILNLVDKFNIGYHHPSYNLQVLLIFKIIRPYILSYKISIGFLDNNFFIGINKLINKIIITNTVNKMKIT